MRVYQFNPDMLPDTCFHPGDLKYVVPGNEGRLLDPRMNQHYKEAEAVLLHDSANKLF
jgi:hypothetical protein